MPAPGERGGRVRADLAIFIVAIAAAPILSTAACRKEPAPQSISSATAATSASGSAEAPGCERKPFALTRVENPAMRALDRALDNGVAPNGALPIFLDASGVMVSAATDGGTGLRRVSLCATPLLAPTDPLFRRAFLGKEVWMFDGQQQKHWLGHATDKDIGGEPKLTFFVTSSPDNKASTIRLTYRFTLFGGDFSGLVDANTGEFVTLEQGFVI